MMIAHKTSDHLMDLLPPVRGTYSADFELARLTWLRVGGPAEVLFRPADADDLAAFLAAKPAEVPVTVIGIGANLLIRDGGVPGVVIRLGRPFAWIEVTPERVRAGAAALDANVAKACRDGGVAGLEFLIGVPGTIGGAIRMNAGAYGREIKDVLVAAEALDARGGHHRFEAAELALSYRHCSAPLDLIFTRAELIGRPGDPAVIAGRMTEIAEVRAASQPIRTRTGGSTFVNPTPPGEQGPKAWELIDAAGCRGLRCRGAMVSEKHCNFLVNTGNATATDLESLGEEVRRRVRKQTGVQLEWEVRRIGVPAGRPWW